MYFNQFDKDIGFFLWTWKGKLWINVFTILQVFQQNQPAALLWHLLKSWFNFFFLNVNQPTNCWLVYLIILYNPTPDIATCFINTSCILQSSFHYNRVLFLCRPTWLVAALQYTHRMSSSLAIHLVLFTGGSDDLLDQVKRWLLYGTPCSCAKNNSLLYKCRMWN